MFTLKRCSYGIGSIFLNFPIAVQINIVRNNQKKANKKYFMPLGATTNSEYNNWANLLSLRGQGFTAARAARTYAALPLIILIIIGFVESLFLLKVLLS